MGSKKKIVAFVFVIITLCPVIAFYTLSICKKIVQHQMEEKMERSLLQTIVAKKGSFTWIKMNKEILINGKMFDVKSYNTNVEETTFKGLYDEDEKKIVQDINELSSEKNEPLQPTLQLLKVLLATYTFKVSEYPNNVIFKEIKNEYFNYDELLAFHHTSIFLPPPNL